MKNKIENKMSNAIKMENKIIDLPMNYNKNLKGGKK